jgi:ribosomal protein S18 acetylase RimI-like enzyme
MLIRAATDGDANGIWSVIEPTIRAGETYALPCDMTKDEALAYWMRPDRSTFVAVDDKQILGTYYLRPNQAGGGNHIANCGYITALEARGRGVARQMCEHSLEYARSRGFKGMQFNFVVNTNEPAIRLWTSLGFEVVGRLPLAFRHPSLGYVDALVMFRAL